MARHIKSRTKKYRPRGESVVGGLYVLGRRIQQENVLTDDEQLRVKADFYSAIDAMVNGRGTGGHFDTLVYACNIARIICEHAFTEDYDELVYPALCAMKRCKDRWQRTGAFGLDGEGIQALRNLAPLHEALLGEARAKELNAAIKEMHRRIAAGITFDERQAA